MKSPRQFRFWKGLVPVLALLAALDVSMAAAKAKPKAKPVGWEETITVYGDMCAKTADGDLMGLRLFLLDSGSDFYVLLQTAQGELMRPDLGDATVKEGEIRFNIQHDGEARLSFKGKITPGMITGSFSDGRTDRHKAKTFHFKRLPNKKAPLPLCGK